MFTSLPGPPPKAARAPNPSTLARPCGLTNPPIARGSHSTPLQTTFVAPFPVPSPLRPTLPRPPHHSHPGERVAADPPVDTLGTYAQQAAAALRGGQSFASLCRAHRGPPCMADPAELPHEAAALLTELRQTGAPALLNTPNWSLPQLDAAQQRGPHQSTLAHVHFMREEFSAMVAAGQWLVAPYEAVRDLPGLRLSPTGVIPQRDRRPRPIVDYTYSGVNPATDLRAPPSLQFGRAFERFLQRLQQADTRHGPIYLAKTDIADAFMRVWIRLDTIPGLAALLPTLPGTPPLVAFPMILPMGWVSSPNYLCALTETIADLANRRLAANQLAPTRHRLDHLASVRPARVAAPLPDTPLGPQPSADAVGLPPPRTRSTGPLRPPLNVVEVYMDDFLQAAQGDRARRQATRGTLFESIDQVLRPLSPDDRPERKEPNSTKKLAKGDACWSTSKSILGWLIDTSTRTIQLLPHRQDRLLALLHGLPPTQRRTSRRKWQQLVGELRSMALAIPGGRGLFSQLQSVLTYPTQPRPNDRLALTPAVHDQLADLLWLAQALGARPTRWAEVVDTTPAFLGTTDASGTGMGGVWLDPSRRHPPLYWRYRYPAGLASKLVTADHRGGTVTNSDLEQAALVCHPDIVATRVDVRERTLCALSDNTAAVSRATRGSTTTTGPAAYLCRLHALHQRAHRYRLTTDYLPGPLNLMADDLSRRWDLSDTQLAAHFSLAYPQAQPWVHCQPRPAMISSLILALSGQRCDPASLQAASPQPTPTGSAGPTFVDNTAVTLSPPRARIQSPGSKYSRSEYEMAGYPPPVDPSELERWRKPSPRWRRPTQWLASPTLASPPGHPISTRGSDASWALTTSPTPRHLESSPSLWTPSERRAPSPARPMTPSPWPRPT